MKKIKFIIFVNTKTKHLFTNDKSMNLVFATNNLHKLREVENILCNRIKLLSLKDINCFEEIPEEQDTIQGNASQKANFIYQKYKINCFADDTGLEISALHGRPGVFSARYAGENCSFEDNIAKVLAELKGKEEREARFRTVISLILNGEERQFEGIVNGIILKVKKGREGFGYDPIFQPLGYNTSFAEMPPEVKNRISHRAMAVKLMAKYLDLL